MSLLYYNSWAERLWVESGYEVDGCCVLLLLTIQKKEEEEEEINISKTSTPHFHSDFFRFLFVSVWLTKK